MPHTSLACVAVVPWAIILRHPLLLIVFGWYGCVAGGRYVPSGVWLCTMAGRPGRNEKHRFLLPPFPADTLSGGGESCKRWWQPAFCRCVYGQCTYGETGCLCGPHAPYLQSEVAQGQPVAVGARPVCFQFLCHGHANTRTTWTYARQTGNGVLAAANRKIIREIVLHTSGKEVCEGG